MKRSHLLILVAALLALTPSNLLADSWKFGVMSDTQWKANLDGKNPDTVAVGIINQINAEFAKHRVKFVIQVGDLTDDGSAAAMTTRATAAQALYDARIGFFPLRGNHEGSQAAALQFQTLFPQAASSGTHVFGATNFTSPFVTLNGLSYSFDYRGARFILLDQFTRTDGTNYLNSTNNNIVDQLPWIQSTLAGNPRSRHAFVLSHKELIGQNHVDTLFGASPTANPDARNTFISALMHNGVRYAIGGHDHMHHQSIIKSPDSLSSVMELIAASDSYKFYTPANPPNDTTGRETVNSQELYTVGYYIFTVDGPRVTVDYYSSPNGCNGDCDLTATPSLTFTKHETFGYSLNGKEFLIAEGDSYASVHDSFEGTEVRILDGRNTSTAKDYAGRPWTQAVNTGWTEDDDREVVSNILTLWGMAKNVPGDETSVYTISMNYDGQKVNHLHLGTGTFGLVSKDSCGRWVNTVNLNTGGTKKFVVGAWKPGMELGTYGVDPSSKTVWAVVNHAGDFAVASTWDRDHDRGGKH
jgi:hypothetical protein